MTKSSSNWLTDQLGAMSTLAWTCQKSQLVYLCDNVDIPENLDQHAHDKRGHGTHIKTPIKLPSVLTYILLVIFLIGCHATTMAAHIEAIAGKPFGVGRIRIPTSPQQFPVVLGAEGISVSNPNGRILYPTLQAKFNTGLVKELVIDSPWMRGGPVREQAGGILRGLLDQPPVTTVYFLFRGDEPLEVVLRGQTTEKMVVRPWNNPHAHARLLGAWWRNYAANRISPFRSTRDYPPVVSNYLQAMLARRLQLPIDNLLTRTSWQQECESQLGFFLGTEKVRLSIARDRMLGRSTSTAGSATMALPDSPKWPPMDLPEVDADVKIESIADRVPAECLYVRFGTFNNFLWCQDTLKTWGGDLSNLASLRGLDKSQSKRMEQQLVLKQTALSRLLGPTIISDVAVVGTDMFMREGAAYGILFEARNRFLLENDLKRQRSERLAKGGVSEEKLKIAGHDVSLLSSPDGSVRSYYVADDKYIFVTTSKTLVQRFLETAKGGPSLGNSAEFRHARSVMPLSRDDTIFVYLSDAFFQNMASPRYWIEIYRRLQATADVQLLEMAMLASATEGKPTESIDALIAGGFLPREFGARADGSRALLLKGEAVDSLRGRRGYFTPIPDVASGPISKAEADAYQNFVDFCRAKWGRFDPILIGVKRHAPVNRVERIVLDIRANPFARRHYDLLSRWLGPADRDRIAPIAGDMMAVEAQLTNQRLFGAVRDFGPSPVMTGTWRDLLYGYVGTTGPLGFLSLLDQRINTPENANGVAGEEGRLWRQRNEHFTIFSLHPGILATVWPQLRFVPAKRPAQVRIHVSDISKAQITPTLARMSFLRTQQTTLGNLRLLHDMTEQLHVPPADALAVAELLLDARLVCPLGGEYEYIQGPDGQGFWTSTALNVGPDGQLDKRVPAGYTAPPLSWFRGLEVEVTMEPRELVAHAEVLMLLPDKPLLSEPKKSPKPEEIPAPEGT